MDIKAIRDHVKAGKSLKELVDDDTLLRAVAQSHKFIEKLEKMYAAKQRDWHTYTHVYYGPPGTGKTRRAKFEAEAKYGADNVFWLPPPENGRLWWDGYNGEPAVIIDEYYGSFMPQTLLQRVCDRYPLRVPTKGSTVPLLAKEIWITSNFEPVSWYKKGLGPLARRLAEPLGRMVKMEEEWKPPAAEPPTEVIDLTCQETLDDTFSERVKTLKRERDEIRQELDAPWELCDELLCPEDCTGRIERYKKRKLQRENAFTKMEWNLAALQTTSHDDEDEDEDVEDK